MPPPIIRIQNLWTRFGDYVVHQDLNLQVEQGEILSLVGGSGSGKTTLLRQMLGLERPARGRVEVFGEDIAQAGGERTQRLQNIRARWGMLFQHGALFSALSAFDNVAQPMRELRTLPEQLIRDAALLDEEHLALVAEQATAAGKRCWLERVGTSDPGVIVIHDGKVQEVRA